MKRSRRVEKLARLYCAYALRRPSAPGRLPIRLWLEPTNACNLRCVMCPNSQPDRMKTGMMDLDLFKRIVDEAEGEVHDVNLHHRGESLLHADFPEMARYASGRGMVTRLHTNATRLDEQMSRALIEAGLDFISFSFDGYEKETYESIRIGADFDETLGNVVRFLELKRELGSPGPFTVLEVIEFGRDRAPEEVRRGFHQRLEGVGLDRLVTKPPHNWAGSYDEGRGGTPVPAQPSVRAGGRITPCTFPWFALVVFWNGDVVACPQDFFGENLVGNLHNRTLSEIWNGDELGRLRREMARGELEGRKACAGCDMLDRRTFMRIPVANLKTFLKEMG